MHIESIDTAITPVDGALLARLHTLCDPQGVGSGLHLRVGLACRQGRLRQVIHTQNMVEAVHLFEALRVMGYLPVAHTHGERGLHRLYRHGPLPEARA